MSVAVRPARADERPVVRSMLDEYLVELSAYGSVDLGYPWFEDYWRQEEPRWPYMIEDGDRATIGFALVNTHAPDGIVAEHAMAEFYIVPSARRLGAGLAAAAATFRRHPGTWTVAIMDGNTAALRFWPRAIAAAGANDIERLAVDDGFAYRFRV